MTAPKPGFPRGLLRRSKRARLDYFAAYTIGHAIIVEAVDAVLHAITQPIDTWTPVILVIGPAGVGKTTLIRAAERALAPFTEEVALLKTIPGVDEVAAATIVAEIGTDTTRFPSAKHLASWAGLCPGNRESAGKRLGSKTTPGDTWLKAVLGEVAWAIARRKRDNYLTAQYHRLARKRGVHKAAVAVMHSVLVIAYHILRDKHPYSDLGADDFDTLDRDRLERYYVNCLTGLGYDVTLEPRVA